RSLGSASERKCGKIPSSRPTTNTAGYSSPLAVCSVISETRVPSLSSSSESATSATAAPVGSAPQRQRLEEAEDVVEVRGLGGQFGQVLDAPVRLVVVLGHQLG